MAETGIFSKRKMTFMLNYNFGKIEFYSKSACTEYLNTIFTHSNLTVLIDKYLLKA